MTESNWVRWQLLLLTQIARLAERGGRHDDVVLADEHLLGLVDERHHVCGTVELEVVQTAHDVLFTVIVRTGDTDDFRRKVRKNFATKSDLRLILDDRAARAFHRIIGRIGGSGNGEGEQKRGASRESITLHGVAPYGIARPFPATPPIIAFKIEEVKYCNLAHFRYSLPT